MKSVLLTRSFVRFVGDKIDKNKTQNFPNNDFESKDIRDDVLLSLLLMMIASPHACWDVAVVPNQENVNLKLGLAFTLPSLPMWR